MNASYSAYWSHLCIKLQRENRNIMFEPTLESFPLVPTSSVSYLESNRPCDVVVSLFDSQSDIWSVVRG